MHGKSSLYSEPGEQGGIGDADLASHMHHGELPRAQEPVKRLRADPQPPPRLVEGDQLRRRGEIQGEVLLPCRGRCPAASRRKWHTQGFPSPLRSVRPEGDTGITDPGGLGRDRGDSTNNLC
jgi:hypothetical protein